MATTPIERSREDNGRRYYKAKLPAYGRLLQRLNIRKGRPTRRRSTRGKVADTVREIPVAADVPRSLDVQWLLISYRTRNLSGVEFGPMFQDGIGIVEVPRAAWEAIHPDHNQQS